MSIAKHNAPLTWDELADLYDAANQGSRRARTLPMSKVAEWAERQTDLIYVDDEYNFRYAGVIRQ